MGVHFAKGELVDGTIDVQNPEVLVYEPKNGRLQLVAAEYIVPTEAWDPHARRIRQAAPDGAALPLPAEPESLRRHARSTSCTCGP